MLGHKSSALGFPVYMGSVGIKFLGLGSNIGRGLFVGWVEHPSIFCWVSFLYPTYMPAIF